LKRWSNSSIQPRSSNLWSIPSQLPI
jgi:hypothetical protein